MLSNLLCIARDCSGVMQSNLGGGKWDGSQVWTKWNKSNIGPTRLKSRVMTVVVCAWIPHPTGAGTRRGAAYKSHCSCLAWYRPASERAGSGAIARPPYWGPASPTKPSNVVFSRLNRDGISGPGYPLPWVQNQPHLQIGDTLRRNSLHHWHECVYGCSGQRYKWFSTLSPEIYINEIRKKSLLYVVLG